MTFTPSMVGVTTVDYFHVVPIGSISRTVIKCVGSSKGNCGELPHSFTFVVHVCGLKTKSAFFVDIICSFRYIFINILKCGF